MIDLMKKELDGIIHKIENNMKIYHTKTPNVNDNLLYSENLSEDADWTGSFFMGMVILAGLLTDDRKYNRYLDSFYVLYESRIHTGWKDHDIGFLYQLYAIDAYRLTNNLQYAELGKKAAEALMYRYNPRGGFIRAWGRLIDPVRNGKIIIDCMLNLPLLFCVSQMTGNPYMKEAAYNHAKATLNTIREDGSTYHTFDFDTITGKPLKGENEGGFSNESCWSRGQAWGIYGYYLAYLHTGDQQFLDAAINLTDYFIQNLGEYKMPKWDFKLTEDAPSLDAIDTSAAAIAASAFYDIKNVVSAEKAIKYEKVADEMMMTLIKNYSHTFDDAKEAILEKCYGGGFRDGKRIVRQMGGIFGDYFFMEALVKRTGTPVTMWSL